MRCEVVLQILCTVHMRYILTYGENSFIVRHLCLNDLQYSYMSMLLECCNVSISNKNIWV